MHFVFERDELLVETMNWSNPPDERFSLFDHCLDEDPDQSNGRWGSVRESQDIRGDTWDTAY